MKKDLNTFDINKINKKFQIVSNDYCIWRLPQTIKSFSGKTVFCPICDSKMDADYTLIPISNTHKAKVVGLLCRKCFCLYVNNNQDVHTLLLDNIYSKGFTLNGDELWNHSNIELQRKREKRRMERIRELRKLNKQRRTERYAKLNAVASAEVMICVEYANKMINEIIIVYDQQYADEQKNIFHYSSDAGREFLSAAFAPKRNKQGMFNEIKYRIIERPLYKYKNQNSLPHHIIPIDLTIKKDGGYSSSICNNNYEIVDMLVYSPFTNRYELLKATHDKQQKICFVDISRYRTFVHKYGNPELLPYFESRKKSGLGIDNLNEESILKGYGYVVNRESNLSSTYRQELLAEIIDLNIMKASSIVNFLNFLISTRPHQPEAQSKWREDKHFVENYKVHPERFFIANNK